MSKDDLPAYVTAHKQSIRHRAAILKSEQCGCFHCLAIYAPTAIDEWVDLDDDDVGQTAMCPRCGIDSVIGSSSGYPITTEFLRQMKQHWF